MARRAATVLLAAAALAGCGGDGDGDRAEPAPDPSEVAAQDASAKSDARNAVSEIETCFVDRQSYAGCRLSAALSAVEVEGRADGYEITATSGSGTRFAVTRTELGEIERTCTPEGEGGCGEDGAW